MGKANDRTSNAPKLEVSLVRRVALIDNPILRHFIKKHKLNDHDSLILGVLLDLTDQMKTPIKTTYRAIGETANLPTIEVYHGVQSLHRNRIIEYKPTGNYVHISFRQLDESIEELSLAHRNAEKIRRIEEDLARMHGQKYVPSDDLFDLIYPFVGKLIMAKIAEAFRSMVNYINDRLDSSFSYRMWVYRFKSFRTKVPLAEIILRESLPFYIEEIFLIEKKTSLLLGHASRTGGAAIDKDLVGGMLAAINDFVKTSFRRGDSGLSELHFQDSKITIAESVYFYAALVIKGSPDMQFSQDADSLVSRIHAVYRRPLKNFNGSMDRLAGIERPLVEFIERTNTPAAAEGGRPLLKVKIAGALLLAALVAGASWWGYTRVRDSRRANAISRRIQASIPAYSQDVKISVSGDTAKVTGTVNSQATAEKINDLVRQDPGIATVRNRAVMADYRSVLFMSGKLDGLESRLGMFELVAVKQELEKIVIQFPAGSTALGEAQMLQIRRAFEILRPYPAIHVDIVAFNDPAGGYEVNRNLAEGRMAGVSGYLRKLGVEENRLHVTAFAEDILTSDPRFAEFRDRRGIMLFAKYEE